MDALLSVLKDPKLERNESDELEIIKHESRTWTPEQWEAYLKTLEVQREEQLNPTELQLEYLIPFEWPERCPEQDAELIKTAIVRLNKQQKFVIKNIFFEGKSLSQVAKLMGISRVAVFKHKIKAIRQLRNIIRPRLTPDL